MSANRVAQIIVFLVNLMVPLLANGSTASVTYTYDQLGRINTALYDSGICIAYAYDSSGNRTVQTITTSGSPVLSVWGFGVWGCFPWSSSSK